MSDEQPAVPVTVEWDMTPQEARDLASARANLQVVQGQFNAIASAFAQRVGIPDARKVKYDLEKCVWAREG